MQAPVLRAGDLLLDDRGFVDRGTLAALKRHRKVDVIMPLKANMRATQEAIQRAELAAQWEGHPSREGQKIACVQGVEHMWAEGDVPLNAWVIRFWNKKKQRTDHIVLVTTDLPLSAPWIVRHYLEDIFLDLHCPTLYKGYWPYTPVAPMFLKAPPHLQGLCAGVGGGAAALFCLAASSKLHPPAS
jgi:hypothetical protein